VVAVYKDLQSAWSDKERPDFERMLRDAKSGAFDVLLVWKFDRLARSVLTFERAVRGLTGCGIEFASLSESVDTTTPMGKFTLHLTGALAQLESDTISYRVRAANRHLASTGAAATGGRRCFGYNRDGSVNEDEAQRLSPNPPIGLGRPTRRPGSGFRWTLRANGGSRPAVSR